MIMSPFFAFLMLLFPFMSFENWINLSGFFAASPVNAAAAEPELLPVYVPEYEADPEYDAVKIWMF